MGADLIGFFAIGPRELDITQREAAIAEADRRLNWLREANHLLDSSVPTDAAQLHACLLRSPYLDADTPVPGAEDISIDQLVVELEHLCCNIDGLDTLTGEDAVDRFFPTPDQGPRDWPPVFRDSASVPNPADPSRVIVFAGEQSWGDTPEGAGFRCLAQANVLGIGESLGIHITPTFMTLRIDLPASK